jgi:hypothetical protein
MHSCTSLTNPAPTLPFLRFCSSLQQQVNFEFLFGLGSFRKSHYCSTVAGVIGFTNLGRLDLSQTVFLPSVINWLTASWCLSMATQFGATLLIGYRVWKSAQGTSKGIGASRLAIVWILVESGALFSVTTIFMLGFSRANMGAIFVSALGQISVCSPWDELF